MINKRLKKNLTSVLPCLITFGILIYFCVKDNNFVTLLNVFPKLKMTYFFLSILTMVLYWLLDVIATKKLAPDFFKSIFGYLKLTMYGQFYGAITPFSSGSQPAQVVLLKKYGTSVGRAISVLSQKLFVIQICTVVISSLSILFKGNKFRHKIPGFGILTSIGLLIQCFGILSIVLFYINKRKVIDFIHFALKIGYKIKLVKDPETSSKSLEEHLSYLMQNNFSINCKYSVFFCCFMQAISTYMVSFFLSKAFGLKGFPVFDMIAAQAFVVLLSIANPLPGSAGTTEGGYVILHRPFFAPENIFPSMILFRLVNYYLGLLVGLIFTLIESKKLPSHHNKN